MTNVNFQTYFGSILGELNLRYTENLTIVANREIRSLFTIQVIYYLKPSFNRQSVAIVLKITKVILGF